jgi:hypothetical protein
MSTSLMLNNSGKMANMNGCYSKTPTLDKLRAIKHAVLRGLELIGTD